MKNKLKLIILTILVTLVIPVVFVKAESFPAFPMSFWGSVTIDGSPAPIGTIIKAYYGSVLAGIVTVKESGVYGYTELIKQRLVIGEGAGAITFKVQATGFNGGAETTGRSVITQNGFTSGLTVKKDLAFLSVDTTPPIITLNGGDVIFYKGSTYVDAGATALDNVDGDITVNIVVNQCGYSSGSGGGGSCYSIFASGPSGGSATSGGTSRLITYNVSDAAGNHATQVTRKVTEMWFSSSQSLSENTTVSTSTSNILVDNNNTTSSIVTVPNNVTNATVNVSALTTSTADKTTATIQGAMTINAATTIGVVKVEIPAGIQIVAGTPTWNGIINVPQVKENSTVTATPDSGNTASVSSVIEIGYGDTLLEFNKAVRINIAGQAGKYVGYSRSGAFTQITNICSVDTQVAGDALVAGGDCKIDVGSDLVIWTKHFTSFATYTQTAIPAPAPAPSSGGGGGGGGGGVSVTLPTNYSIKINSNATSTDNRNVRLTLAATNAALMAISNEATFTGINFGTYATTSNWTLNEGVGQKIVYVRFRSSSGGTVDASDSINLTASVLMPLEPTTPASTPQGQVLGEQRFAEGAMIRAIGDIDVYIVKYVGDKQFKRLILSPSVFNSYQHLKWENVLDVEKSETDAFITSELVRAVNDTKVYKLYPAGDTGQKRWVKTAEGFNRMGYDWDAIYEINSVDRNSYVTGAVIE